MLSKNRKDYFYNLVCDLEMIKEKKEQSEIDAAFDEYFRKQSEEELKAKKETRQQIHAFFDKSDSDEIYEKTSRTIRPKKLRLDRKYKPKEKSLKKKKTWVHQNKCEDRISAAKARERVTEKEFKEEIL